MKKIIIGADHGGYEMKQILGEHLKSLSYEVVDIGTHNSQKCDYPDIANSLCSRVTTGEFEKGILICGSGIGISIAANKVHGIRCALCHDHYTAKMSRQHNNANILALGGRVVGPEVAKGMVDVFLSENFLGSYHCGRIEKITNLETTTK